jgi:hypothetical protein
MFECREFMGLLDPEPSRLLRGPLGLPENQWLGSSWQEGDCIYCRFGNGVTMATFGHDLRLAGLIVRALKYW